MVADPAASKVALRTLARRYQQLTDDIAELDDSSTPLVTALDPDPARLHGVGTDVAGQLLVTAGDNPDRLRIEAAFATLCGAAPSPPHPAGPTATGSTAAATASQRRLYRIVLCRLRRDPRTRAYVATTHPEGLSKKEIIRCLKRYIAREVR